LLTIQSEARVAERTFLPVWLYEPLPYVYAGIGMLALFKLEGTLGGISGLMLILAGLLIWRTRQIYRSAARQTPDVKEAPVAGLKGFVRLAWSSEYETGIERLDHQHRMLFNQGNNLLNAILDDKPKLDVELLIDELMHDITDHFCTEESLLARAKHPLSPRHHEIHRLLLARCKAMARDYHDDKLRVGDLFQFVAVDLVSNHILNEDLRFIARPDSTAA
jgi:hemerythrin-like metal-binding protein